MKLYWRYYRPGYPWHRYWSDDKSVVYRRVYDPCGVEILAMNWFEHPK